MPTAMLIDPDDEDTEVRTLYGECRGEPLVGQQAVAWVIRNRAEWHPTAWWGDTIGRVCRKHAQFSCWSEADWNASNLAQMKALRPDDKHYVDLLAVIRSVNDGAVPDVTGGATHYRVKGTPATWDAAVQAHGLHPTSIGHHDFYRLGPGA